MSTETGGTLLGFEVNTGIVLNTSAAELQTVVFKSRNSSTEQTNTSV